MNTIKRILKLKKQEQKIKVEIETLENRLYYKEWAFYVHTGPSYVPMISAWKQNTNTNKACCFIVKEDYVKLYSTGAYQDNWKEAHAIISKWLAEDSSIEPK